MSEPDIEAIRARYSAGFNQAHKDVVALCDALEGAHKEIQEQAMQMLSESSEWMLLTAENEELRAEVAELRAALNGLLTTAKLFLPREALDRETIRVAGALRAARDVKEAE
jgi:hypothetical protein